MMDFFPPMRTQNRVDGKEKGTLALPFMCAFLVNVLIVLPCFFFFSRCF